MVVAGRSRVPGVLGLLCLLPLLVVARQALAVTASDNFNRPDGSLGPNWTDMTSGGLTISSQQVVGTAAAGGTGDIRTAETYGSDQYSNILVSATQLTGGQWIGPAVRVQNGGQSLYVGIYYWDNGTPVLMLFKLLNGAWTQLGGTYSSGALPAGTQLQLSVTGSTLTFSENGAAVITATDTGIASGAPGIMAYGTAAAGDWAGGDSSASGTDYSVGGTISGLTGTVVLQNNGGDTLSLSADGPFTFATQLAPGASYDVTVQTNPTGQSCTVAGGVGTIASANVTSVAVTCAATAAGSVTDNFNRPNGSLGPGWTDMTSGGLTISSQQVVGTNAGGNSGDIRTGETYGRDQSSQIQVAATLLSGTQWIGPAVRIQNGGQSLYVGIYFWNNGSPVLMLFKLTSGAWTQLGTTYASGTLPAGTQLQLAVTGSTLTFSENGAAVITATDTAFTGGAPGIMANGTAAAGSWTGEGALASSGTDYSVGGAVSGLSSGSVVLQDNGSDSLVVSTNGPFTFGTQLAPGASYYVTVQTNPTGQSCTVANGVGTIASANVSNVTVTCTAVTAGSATDSFNRPDGSLGPDWTDMSDGGLAIASQQVIGTQAAATSGDIRTEESYSSDQYSQIQIAATPLSPGQWIGAAVRAQNGGQSLYVGIYYVPSGGASPELMLFLRSGSNWTPLGNTYACGVLPAGTQLKLMVVGGTLAFMENGVERIAAGDPTLTGGAPGIIAYGTATAGNWTGGSAGFEVHYLRTDATGIDYYDMISANNGHGPQILRVLRPTHAAVGVAHNFLYVLPVEAALGNSFGDGLATLQAADAQDQYNVTLIEPSFYIDPWYANNPNDPGLQYETFMTADLQPWVTANLATSGTEQSWLIGFSKSGYGGQDLILKHPDLFTLAASWDFPADMAHYDTLGSDPAANYGTDANFQSNYQLTSTFVGALAAPFVSSDRIWIGGWGLYQQDDLDYEALLGPNGAGIDFTAGPMVQIAHRWDSGWVPEAMAALYQMSLGQP